MRRAVAILLGLGGVAANVALACSNDPDRLPAIGEVILEVDTDAPVPSAVNRVRVDIYGGDGKWLESRDVVRVNSVDWPLSFALKAANDRDTRDVYVRLRAYPEGRIRDYRGERFTDVPTFTEPKVAHTVADLCNATPPIPNGTFKTRLSDRPVTGFVAQTKDDTNDAGANDCSGYSFGGIAAYKVDIATQDYYRFDVLDISPYDTANIDPVLFIRKDCTDPLSQITCADNKNPDRDKALLSDAAKWPSLVAKLDPGSYTLLVTNEVPSATDVTLRWGRAADFAVDAGALDAGQDLPTSGQPRLVVDGGDQTPPTEPLPTTAIDRLVHLQIKPDVAARARVVLRAACSGAEAKLTAPIAQSQTCIDTEKTLVAVPLEALAPNDGVLAKSIQNSAVPNEPCTPADNTDNTVCVPGGSFLFGTLDSPTSGDYATTPERLALMHRFWMDKDEMSVARYRQLLAKGHRPVDATPTENYGPLTKTYASGSLCTWSTEPLKDADNREGFPLNCSTWTAARAACQFLGGELPSEAQWEYAATAAGRPTETRWPWGGEDQQAIDCDRAVTGRADPKDPTVLINGNLYTQCTLRGYGPAPLNAAVGTNGDVTALGVKNLEGSLGEWLLDAFAPYSSACWQATSIYDPLCWQVEPPLRAWRGAAWNEPPLPPVRRSSGRPNGATAFIDLGYRCVYRAKPTVLP